MKGRFVKAAGTILAVLLSLVVVDAVMAGGIINKNNQSADYMRTLNRAAATDYADIAVYNPAGPCRWRTDFTAKWMSCTTARITPTLCRAMAN